MKNLCFLLFLGTTLTFAQDYEERPSLGLYFEPTSIDESSIEFHYKEIPSAGGAVAEADAEEDAVTASYRLKDGIEVSPLIGIGGHLPFLWNPYFNATMVVGFQTHKYNLVSTDERTVEAGTNEKTLTSYTVVIQGGPELGLPLYTDEQSQQMVKLYGFGQVIIGKTFLDSKTNFKNDAYYGYNYGSGLRYAISRFSVAAGVKSSTWIWKPLYDESKGNIDSSIGEDRVNKMRVYYEQFLTPYIDVKLSLF